MYSKNRRKTDELKSSVPKKSFKDIIKTFEIKNLTLPDIDDYFLKIKHEVKRHLKEEKGKDVIKFKLNIYFNFLNPSRGLKSWGGDPLNEIEEVKFDRQFYELRTMDEFEEIYNKINEEVSSFIDEFQGLGSGLIFENIFKTEIKTSKIVYLKGSSYFPYQFPEKRCVLNIRNNDQKCFLWSVLANYFPVKRNPSRVTHYEPYENMINMEKIEYPVKINDIKKIEKLNPHLAINVFGLKNQKDSNTIFPIYCSKRLYNQDGSEMKQTDLLYLESDEKEEYIDNYEIIIQNKSDQSETLSFILKPTLVDENYLSGFTEEFGDIEIEVHENYDNNNYYIEICKGSYNLTEKQKSNIIRKNLFRNYSLKEISIIEHKKEREVYKTHYCLIKNLNTLMRTDTSNSKMFVCRKCLTKHYREESYKKHLEMCGKFEQAKIIMPSESKSLLKFKNHYMQHRLPVVIYADFEAKQEAIGENANQRLVQLEPNKESTTKQLYEQKIISFGIYIQCDYPHLLENLKTDGQLKLSHDRRSDPQQRQTSSDPYWRNYITYTGDDAPQVFVKTIIRIYNEISKKMNFCEPLKISEEEEKLFQEATNCYVCGTSFDPRKRQSETDPRKRQSETDPQTKIREHQTQMGHGSASAGHQSKTWAGAKVREHNHFNGKYRGASCQSCNVKEGKCKQIPVFFHNGSRYDFHFFVTELLKYETEHKKVNILPKTSENYISISYGSYFKRLVFLDSYRFMLKGLSDVAKSLDEKDYKILSNEFSLGETQLSLTDRETSFQVGSKALHRSDSKLRFELIKQKGFYPYEYIDSIERLNETSLPSIDKFYSTLKQETITEEQYEHAQKVWKTFNCKTLLDYHNLYLKTDVLILADAFEKFREFYLTKHNIDPCYCVSSPSLTWQCGLKYTNTELNLLTDNNMFLMFEKGIRGGFSGVLGSRHVKTNNKYLGDYNPEKPSNYLLYLDANNLYGWAMSQPLPVGDFKWEDPKRFDEIFQRCKEDENYGCILEVDLEIDEETKNRTFKFPLAPFKRKIEKDELSDYQLKYLNNNIEKVGNTEKLVLDLYDKEKYVVHYKLLEFYEKMGMKIKKIHNIISFKEEPWLAKYINLNTEERKKAKTNFEKDLFKLNNNAFYGKTLENIRGKKKIKLTSSSKEAKRYTSKASYSDHIIFNENLVGILSNVFSITFNKPIYLGMCILDYSKLLMYQFYYETFNKLFPDNEVCYMDTDSLFINVYSFKKKNEKVYEEFDIYKDLEKIKDQLDTNEYPASHPLHSLKNKKVIGKFKDELNGEIIKEAIFLRSKAYSFLVAKSTSDPKAIKKLKGITYSIVKNQITFEDYKNCLFGENISYTGNSFLHTKKHRMFVEEVNKKTLSPFDDKRYILEDGINTLAHQ